jgi:hypothetical protein
VLLFCCQSVSLTLHLGIECVSIPLQLGIERVSILLQLGIECVSVALRLLAGIHLHAKSQNVELQLHYAPSRFVVSIALCCVWQVGRNRVHRRRRHV